LGCASSSSQNFTISKVQITATNDTAIVINQPLQLNANGANSYTWLPASVLTNANSARPIFSINSPGIFPLLVKGTTSQGCLGTDTVIVTVYKTPIGLLLPNAFSPNADGRNDVLNINCTGLQALNFFRIINRYGQTIFEQRNCRSLGWDGTYNGTKQNPGTYVYYWEGTNFTGRKVIGKGTVVLVR
jgi:gliding motility-associated-like protein